MRNTVLKDAPGQPERPRYLSIVGGPPAPPPPASPSPVEAYLMGLAPGSRRTMAQALAVIAQVIVPSSSAMSLDWSCVTFADTNRVRAALAERYAPAAANKGLAALRGTLKSAFRLGLITGDHLARATDLRPVRGQRLPRGRALAREEVAALIAACDRTTNLGRRDAALIAVGFGCGLRRSELVSLDVVDLENGAERVRVRGKGDKERVVFLPVGTQAHVRVWLDRRGPEPGPLFVAVEHGKIRHRRLVDQTVYDTIERVASKAGVTSVSPHDLRRSYVSTLLDQGVQLSTVAACAGHASLETCARYDRRGERAKREAAAKLVVPA
jgi:integrase